MYMMTLRVMYINTLNFFKAKNLNFPENFAIFQFPWQFFDFQFCGNPVEWYEK